MESEGIAKGSQYLFFQNAIVWVLLKYEFGKIPTSAFLIGFGSLSLSVTKLVNKFNNFKKNQGNFSGNCNEVNDKFYERIKIIVKDFC